MKLLLSFVTLSLLGSASLVKFFEAPSELLLGEPIYNLAVSERSDAYQTPPPMSDNVAAIPGVAVGNFSQSSPATTDISSFRQPATRKVVREAAPVPQETPLSEPVIEPAEKPEINDVVAGVPVVKAVVAEPDLASLAATTAQPQNNSPANNTQDVAALTPAPASVDVGEPIVSPLSPIANIELPVRAPVYITSREGASAALGNIGTGVSGSLSGPLLNSDGLTAAQARRKAIRRATAARRKARQASAKPKPKVKIKPIVSWQSGILGNDD